ncbi:MAG: hypothetical protein ABI877_18285, partial [Gemmatimonadaceae bacterium]
HVAVDARQRRSSSLDVAGADSAGRTLLLPFARALSHTVSTSSVYRISPMALGRAELSYMRSTFDGVDVIGGSSLSGMVALQRRYNSKGTMGVLGERSATATGDLTINVSSLATEWTGGTGAFRAALRAGVSDLETSESSGMTLMPIGLAEARFESRGVAASIHYSRTALQAFGLGRALASDQIGFSYQRVLRVSYALRLSADQSWSADPTAESVRLGASTVLADVRRNVLGASWISVGGFYRRRSQETVVATSGVTVGVGLTRSR